jgi:magnesium-transporting ATPase (P-type)
MAFVLVRTYRGSKFPFLYTCGGLMLTAAVLRLIQIILFNWDYGCTDFSDLNEKCHGQQSKAWSENVFLFTNICGNLSSMFFYQGHFVFAYRYLESAEMLSNKQQTKAKYKKKTAISQKISYTVAALIAINFLTIIAHYLSYRFTGNLNETLQKWTYTIIPLIFMVGICVILLVALTWICKMFWHDDKLVSSEKWMALHSLLLVIVLIA